MFDKWGGREKVKFWSDFARREWEREERVVDRADIGERRGRTDGGIAALAVAPLDMASKVKSIWIGSVETAVCSRARVFVGTQKSTFTGYINRLRGWVVARCLLL